MLEGTLGDCVSAFQKFAECRYSEITGKKARVNDFQIVNKGRLIMNCKIIRSNRKSIGLEVNAEGLIIRAPLQATDAEINMFILQHKSWIEKHLNKVEEQQKKVDAVEPLMKSFRVLVNTSVGSVFYSWIFGFCGKVMIKSPEKVKEEYAQMVRDAAQALQ